MNKIYFVGNSELIPSTLYEKKTIEDCAEWLNTLDEVNLDTETEGMFNHKNKILMLQLNWEDISYVIDVRYTNLNLLKDKLESILVVGQNLKFDYKFLKFHGIELNNIYDTMLAECCITNGLTDRTLNLKGLADKYCKITLNKDVRNQFSNLNGQPFTEQQIVYGVGDVTCLTQIKTEQLKTILKYDIINWVDNENKSCLGLADMEYNGMGFNKEAWKILADNAMFNEDSYFKLLDEFVINDPKLKKFIKTGIQSNMFVDLEEGYTHERSININWKSPVQVDKVFKQLGIKAESTSEKHISKFQNKYPIIKQFIDYKKQQKLVSTYGLEFFRYINSNTHRIHTSFWQILNTSRVSSGDDREGTPNMQNIPAQKEYRNCFTARPGFKIVSCDFAGQELRLTAEGSKETLWIDAFNKGEDLHSNTASLIFNIPLSEVRNKPDFLRGKSYRDAAKTINFGIIYGMSKFKLADQLNIDIKVADKIIKDYFKNTPFLCDYLNKCKVYGIRKGYIRSFRPYSIIRQFPNWKNLKNIDDFTTEGNIERASMNTPIQGSGAQMMKLAIHKIRTYIKEYKLQDKVYMVMTVHDQIDCEVESNYAEEWSLIQKRLMEESGQEFIKSIPVLSDITISDSWTK